MTLSFSAKNHVTESDVYIFENVNSLSGGDCIYSIKDH